MLFSAVHIKYFLLGWLFLQTTLGKFIKGFYLVRKNYWMPLQCIGDARWCSSHFLLQLYHSCYPLVNIEWSCCIVLLKWPMALFASLIIRLFQFVFSVGTVFFSHNKSAETVFWLVFQRSERDLSISCKIWATPDPSKAQTSISSIRCPLAWLFKWGRWAKPVPI